MANFNEINQTISDSNDPQKQYEKYQFIDPFRNEISPALLNGYDIETYIKKCGIISPYEPDNVGSATYKIPMYGDVYSWNDKKSKMAVIHLTRDKPEQTITLKQNSITYFHIDTIFRVPYYMVFRFNLTVSLAHKGLLLGTGPIVDPGFQGRILIPVHNLTANDYTLRAGSGLIRVEFTKLSHNDLFCSYNNQQNTYKFKFPKKAINLTATQYFDDIHSNRPIVSSIPEAMQSAEISAKAAMNSLSKIKLTGLISAIIALFGLGGGIIYPTYSLVQDTHALIDTLSEKTSEIKLLKDKVEKQEKSIDKLETIIKTKTIVKKEIIKDSTGQCLIIKGQSDEKNRDMRGDCIRQNDPCFTSTTK